MKCSSNPVDVPALVYARTDQPEVTELEPEDGWKQWRLATRLNEGSESEWERTMPMGLVP